MTVLSLVLTLVYDFGLLGCRPGAIYCIVLGAAVYKMMRAPSALSIFPDWMRRKSAQD